MIFYRSLPYSFISPCPFLSLVCAEVQLTPLTVTVITLSNVRPFAVLNKATFHHRIRGPTPQTRTPSAFNSDTPVCPTTSQTISPVLRQTRTSNPTHTPSSRQMVTFIFPWEEMLLLMKDIACLVVLKQYFALFSH